jgi:NitT/TauT family transport system substrate-binding protein
MVSQELLARKPQAVRGLLRAINRAIFDVMSKPDDAIALLAKIEPLINADIEKKRLLYFIEQQMVTPETAALGLGDLDDKRLSGAIETVVEAYQLSRKPDVREVFDRSFLPPRAERNIAAAAK